MNAWEFETKLRRLNPRLYVGKRINPAYNPELLSTGIYLKDQRDEDCVKVAEEASQISVDDEVEAPSAAQLRRLAENDRYLGFCTVRHIPEGNWYDTKGKVTARGWRELLLCLSHLRLIDLQKARRIFNRPGLGVETYDRLTHQQKKERYLRCQIQS